MSPYNAGILVTYSVFIWILSPLGEHVDLAKKYGALIFSVEHRFYGGSINKDGLELGQLQYLSSQQA